MFERDKKYNFAEYTSLKPLFNETEWVDEYKILKDPYIGKECMIAVKRNGKFKNENLKTHNYAKR